MRYGKELIDEISKPVIKIDSQIAELQKEHDKLQNELAKNKDNFDMAVVKASQKTTQELALITSALENAKRHRKQILDKNAKEYYPKIVEYIKDIRAKEAKSRVASVEKIKSFINEARKIYKGDKKHDDEVAQGIKDLINGVKPYLGDEKILQGGNYSVNDELSRLTNSIKRTGMRELDYFDEAKHGISGLIPNYMELKD